MASARSARPRDARSAPSRVPRPAGFAPRRARREGHGARWRVRWDRLGRTAMLFVLLVLLGLFIGPARALVSTLSQSSQRHAEVNSLLRENIQLKARAAALQRPGTLEAEARGLGLVKPGERPYVIFGLPAN